jgi:hypothetical protein
MENKTHYRKVFKSDHLGVADLEDFIEEKKRLVFTIKEVKQYELKDGDKNSGIVVAGRRIGANIAYFIEPIKPLVINDINSKAMKSFNNGSPFVQDWANTIVELYIDPNVKMKGAITGGVRIKPNQPRTIKPELIPTMKKVWDAAIAHMSKGGDISKIKDNYTISTENEKKLKNA